MAITTGIDGLQRLDLYTKLQLQGRHEKLGLDSCSICWSPTFTSKDALSSCIFTAYITSSFSTNGLPTFKLLEPPLSTDNASWYVCAWDHFGPDN